MKKICINCANLHIGGGIQVAISFLYDLIVQKVYENNFKYSIYASTEVYNGLSGLLDVSPLSYISKVDVYGMETLKKSDIFDGYDIIFTLFGPSYIINSSAKTITGFAQSWIIYPEVGSHVYKKNFLARLINKVKFKTQWWFFQRSDCLIVELDHVKSGLINIGYKKNIHVIKNCVSPVFFEASLWKDLKFLKEDSGLCIGCIGRGYPHKNIEIVSKIAKILNETYLIKCTFYVTLTDNEYYNFKENKYIKNVGVIELNQCPIFYEKMDAVVFPSLLESFSATPIEALIMKRPLFASDRKYVRDVCGPYAYYFDPNSAHDIAEKIKKFFSGELLAYDRDAAYDHVVNFSSSASRTEGYVNLIKSFSEE